VLGNVVLAGGERQSALDRRRMNAGWVRWSAAGVRRLGARIIKPQLNVAAERQE
jgi:hypothetical protein